MCFSSCVSHKCVKLTLKPFHITNYPCVSILIKINTQRLYLQEFTQWDIKNLIWRLVTKFDTYGYNMCLYSVHLKLVTECYTSSRDVMCSPSPYSYMRTMYTFEKIRFYAYMFTWFSSLYCGRLGLLTVPSFCNFIYVWPRYSCCT